MPLSMQEEWSIPSFLICGGYTENLAFTYTHSFFSFNYFYFNNNF